MHSTHCEDGLSTVTRMAYGCTPFELVDTMVAVMADGRGGKITWWVIKYPYTKKNAQPYVYPLYQVCPKSTSYGCTSDLKNLHSSFLHPAILILQHCVARTVGAFGPLHC